MGFLYKSDPTKMQQLTKLKYVVVTRFLQRRKSITHMAIITEDGKFAEYEFGIYLDSITPLLAARIRSMFEGYQVTSSTEVIFTQEYEKTEPLYVYFQFLHQQLQFNMRRVTIETILRTIAKYHGMFYNIERTKISRKFLDSIWVKIVEKNRCPWITQQFDDHIKNQSVQKARERKLIRLAAYYLIVKNFLALNSLKYKQKASASCDF